MIENMLAFLQVVCMKDTSNVSNADSGDRWKEDALSNRCQFTCVRVRVRVRSQTHQAIKQRPFWV